MKCDEVKDKMMDYLFSELEESESKQFDLHLNSCKVCRAELKEFQATVNVAEKWPEVKPRRDIVFVTPKSNLFEKATSFFQLNSGQSRFKWAGRLAFVALILVIIFMRSEIHYSQGQFSLRIGSDSAQTTQLNSIPPEFISALRSLQEENLSYTHQMIRESEQRQQNLLFTGLSQISNKIDQSRKVDLNYVGENLQRLERNNLHNFDKTNAMLQDVLKVAAGYPIKK